MRPYQYGLIAGEYSIENMLNIPKNLAPDKIVLAENIDLSAKDLCHEKESDRLLNLIRGTILKAERMLNVKNKIP
jgi:hypothetical protein